MKKLFSTMLAVGVAVLLSGVAFAHDVDGDPRENDADPACTDDAVCVDTSDADPDGAAPIGGVVAANGDPEAQSGYIFADGNGANPEPLAGYIGLNSAEQSSSAPLSGATSGHYHRDGDNSALDPTALLPPM